MSAPLDKTALVRTAWIAALRREGHRQCTGAYTSGNLRCAIGLLREVALPRSKWSVEDSIASIGAHAGLTPFQAREIVVLNDAPGDTRAHSFEQIADIVEGWFSPPP